MDKGLVFIFICFFLVMTAVGLGFYFSLITTAEDICEVVYYGRDNYFIQTDYNKETGIVNCSFKGRDIVETRIIHVEQDKWGSLHTRWD